MGASRSRPKDSRKGAFGLTTFLAILMPTSIGYQDLAALIARQPAVTERWRQHVLASPFGTIHAATFSFPRPIGSAIPDPFSYQLANFKPDASDVTGSIPPVTHLDPFEAPQPPLEFPAVDRTRKGDLLVPRKPRPDEVKPQPQKVEERPQQAESTTTQPPQSEGAMLPMVDLQKAEAPMLDFAPAAPVAVAAEAEPASRASSAETSAEILHDVTLAHLPATPFDQAEQIAEEDGAAPESAAFDELQDENPAMRMARLYFGPDAVTPGALRPWQPGEAPILQAPEASIDPDIKRSATAPDDAVPAPSHQSETIAPKGQVTGEGKRPKTPAERLGLEGKSRARHERCLANAIYFESRGEPERGQMAVAQVVMNRVFSGKYPDNVCGVVYQNAHRHMACQFTFACDNVKDVVTEPEAWEVAKRIARDTLDGKLWLADVGKATHYHAYWVHPSWVHEMKKMYKFGVHTFYRPRAWGNGADEPAWGSGAKTNAPRDVAPQANATPTQVGSAAAARL